MTHVATLVTPEDGPVLDDAVIGYAVAVIEQLADGSELAHLEDGAAEAPVHLHRMDSTGLALPDERYDRALVFFLLHEQPSHDRERPLS